MARLRIVPLPIILRRLVVLDATDLTPRMRRVRVGGPELGAFIRDGMSLPAFVSTAFDDHVKVILAPGGDLADALPVQLEHGIRWRPCPHLVTRDYTPVHVDVDGGSVTFDFVVHTERGEAAGPAEEWARAARPGDDLWIVGPKSSTVVPDDADWALLAGDETAQPAVERFLSERPVAGPARIVLAVADESAKRDDLPLGPDDTLTWVTAPPGDRQALADAVAAVPPPAGTAYVWAAAESRSLLPIRKYVARDLGVPKDHADITGYWHVRAGEPDPEQTTEDAATTGPVLPVVTSPVTWFAVRAALRLGLLDAVDAHRPTRADLAVRLAVPVGRTAPLVDVLVACDVLTETDGRLALGAVGDEVLTDEHLAESFDGVHADQMLALADLAEALPTGRSAWETGAGQSFAARAHEDAAVFAELVDDAASRVFLLPAITGLPVFDGRRRIAFTGPGAAVVADGVVEAGRHGDASTTVVQPGPGLAALRAAAGAAHEFSDAPFADHDPFDLVVAIDALRCRDDRDAEEFLASLRGAAREALVIESTSADALSPRVLEQSLVHLATVGEPARTADGLAAAAQAAGWSVTGSAALGWGVDAVTLVPAAR